MRLKQICEWISVAPEADPHTLLYVYSVCITSLLCPLWACFCTFASPPSLCLAASINHTRQVRFQPSAAHSGSEKRNCWWSVTTCMYPPCCPDGATYKQQLGVARKPVAVAADHMESFWQLSLLCSACFLMLSSLPDQNKSISLSSLLVPHSLLEVTKHQQQRPTEEETPRSLPHIMETLASSPGVPLCGVLLPDSD